MGWENMNALRNRMLCNAYLVQELGSLDAVPTTLELFFLFGSALQLQGSIGKNQSYEYFDVSPLKHL